MEGGKVKNEERFFSLFKTTKFVLGLPKWNFFYREKAFHARKKIRKNDFAPSQIFSCYAPISFNS